MCLAAAVLGGPVRLWAQDPFGADPFGADPFGAAKPAPKVEPATSEVEAATEDEETDPVVLAIRASGPRTPEQLFRAIQSLINYGRPDEAKKYAQLLLGLSPDAATLVDLQRQFGSGFLFRIIRQRDFQPEGQQLGMAVLEAGYQAARDPDRLRDLIDKLSDPDAEVRHTALVDLRDAGDAAASALVATLADPGRRANHEAARNALCRLGVTSRDPLIAALESPDSALRAQVLEVLGRLRATEALPYLLRPFLGEGEPPEVRQAAQGALLRIVGAAPSRQEAEDFLFRQAGAYLAGRIPGEPDEEGLLPVWRWDEPSKTSVAAVFDGPMASRWVAARIAAELRTLAPENAEYRRLHLTSALELAKAAGGLGTPLPASDGGENPITGSADAQDLEEVLVFAMQEGRTPAAIGALEVLADIGDASLLHGTDGRPRPVALALQHRDRRVRFAAAMAIMRWDPLAAYAGSSYLPSSLAYFARAAGTRRVLIGHPRTQQAQTLVGLLNELGFEADTADSGREMIRLATENPDYEFLLLSDALDHPRVEELIQQLRREPTTAALPAGVMAREPNFKRLQRFTDLDPLADTFPRPHDVAGMNLLARRLLAMGGLGLVSTDWRMYQAGVALDYLAHIAEHRKEYAFYDVLSQQEAIAHALNVPRLTARAARVLGFLGSPDAQRALVMVASQNGRRLSEREAAASAFHVAVHRRGVLLLRREILLQYDRYNRSARLDQGTQRVLGAILDTIEQKE
jgi:HEAT repeat protein